MSKEQIDENVSVETEIDKLPPEVKKEMEKDEAKDRIENGENVDWYGLEQMKKNIDDTDEDIEDSEQEIENNLEASKEKAFMSNKLVSSVVNGMVEIFSSSNENKEIKESPAVEMGYAEVGNVKIKDGVIYAKKVQDIIDSGIKPSLGNLWVVVPHKVTFENGYSYQVKLRYVVHNGDWWVAFPESTVLENIKFSLFDINTLSSNKKAIAQ